MSVEQFQQDLLTGYNNAPDEITQKIAQAANELTEMFKSGQITRDEYTQVMSDLANEANISKSTANMQLLENMNVAINGLISLARLA